MYEQPPLIILSADLLRALPYAITAGFTLQQCSDILLQASSDIKNFSYSPNFHSTSPYDRPHHHLTLHLHTGEPVKIAWTERHTLAFQYAFNKTPELTQLLSHLPPLPYQLTPSWTPLLSPPLYCLPSNTLTLSPHQICHFIQTYFPDFTPSAHATAFFSTLEVRLFAPADCIANHHYSPSPPASCILRLEITTPYSTDEDDYTHVLHAPVSVADNTPFTPPIMLLGAAYQLLRLYIWHQIVASASTSLQVLNIDGILEPPLPPQSPETTHHLVLNSYNCRLNCPIPGTSHTDGTELFSLFPHFDHVYTSTTRLTAEQLYHYALSKTPTLDHLYSC